MFDSQKNFETFNSEIDSVVIRAGSVVFFFSSSDDGDMTPRPSVRLTH